MPTSMIEPEYGEAYETWRKDPSPANNALVLKTIQPSIDRAVQHHIGQSNPLIASRARRLALDSLRTYEPGKSRLQTHLFNQMQGLKRIHRQQGQSIQVPERVVLDKQHLYRLEQELGATLGREPSDAELADHSGLSLKRLAYIRTYRQPLAEGTIENPETGGIMGDVHSLHPASAWPEIVYGDLAPLDQKIMEYGLGMRGRERLPNAEIARRLRRSPGFISQRKLVIQKLLDREQELSPF